MKTERQMHETRMVDLRKLNSATKYPSIPTFHKLGDKGALLDETIAFDSSPLIVTEKIDGTNSRIILMPDGCYLIGSREELLHAQGDLIHNPALGIVETLRPVAEKIVGSLSHQKGLITTVYLETYGGKTTAAAKQYTGTREFGYRIFDINQVPVDRLNDELEAISSWRESGGQSFLSENELTDRVAKFEIAFAPRLAIVDELPTDIHETHQWLKSMIPETRVALDDQAGGQAEGVVVRTFDRSQIAKIRYEDYERHARREAKKRK